MVTVLLFRRKSVVRFTYFRTKLMNSKNKLMMPIKNWYVFCLVVVHVCRFMQLLESDYWIDDDSPLYELKSHTFPRVSPDLKYEIHNSLNPERISNLQFVVTSTEVLGLLNLVYF